MGVMDDMLATLAREAELEWLMIDFHPSCARREVDSVVGEDGLDFIGDGGDYAMQEISGGSPRELLVQFDEVRWIATTTIVFPVRENAALHRDLKRCCFAFLDRMQLIEPLDEQIGR